MQGTDTQQFVCAGQGEGMCGDQQLLPGITNLLQNALPLLPSTTLETTHQNLGIYFLVIFPPSCARAVCAQSGMEPSTSWQRS